MKLETKDKLYMLFLLITGVLIRLFFMFKPKDIWHDEAFTILFSQKSLWFILSANDVHPPLYYLIIKPILFLTTNEYVLRSVSLIFFVAFFIILYLLLKKQFTMGTRWFTLTLITLSPTFIFYSIEIRNYMLGVFLVTTQIYYFFKIIKNYNNNKNYNLFILFSVLMLYNHYYSCFVLLVEFIYLLRINIIKYNKRYHLNYKIMKFFHPFLIIFIFITPLILYFFLTLNKMQSMWFKQIDFGSFISTTTYQFLFPEMFVSSTIHIFIVLFISILVVFIFRKMTKTEKFYLSLFYVPVILLWLISQVSPVYHHRFFLFYAIGLYIIIGRGISLLYNSKTSIYYGIFICALFLSVLFNGIMVYDSVQNKELQKSQLVLKDYLNQDKEYYFIHESTFSMSPMKVYFKDYDNVKHYLINNLTRKQLFTAGGSVVEDDEIINNNDLDRFKLKDDNNIIYVSSYSNELLVYKENVIYKNGGLLIYD